MAVDGDGGGCDDEAIPYVAGDNYCRTLCEYKRGGQ